jgi:two-component system, NarL family, invasion response regulator UvrY
LHRNLMMTVVAQPRGRTAVDPARSRPIRALIADDHPLIIGGLTMALGRQGIEVVAQATSASEIVDAFGASTPDVVVLDLRFGQGQTGLDVAQVLVQRFPAARIVVYSQFDQDEVVREAYRAGAVGFVPKSKPTAVLAEAIKHVHAGKTHFVPEIAERLALMHLGHDDSPRALLDARELEVFKRIALGQTNVQIAEDMGLSAKTVSNTSQAIKDKLGMHRPADLTRLAVKHGVIDP